MKRNLKKTSTILMGVSFCLASCSVASPTKIQAFQCDALFEYLDYEEGRISNSLKEEVDKLENIFDPYKEGTELYRLNKERTLTVSDDLLSCLKEAVALKEDTDGYFNPFMGKLSKDWMSFINEKRDNPLSEEEINAHLTEIGSTSLSFEGNKVTINGTADIDLSGICKGYIIDKLYESVKDKTEYYMVNAGHSSVLLGKKNNKDNDSFIVSLLENEFTFTAKDTTISTSGVNEQYRIHSDGNMYSHLINPKTGSAKVHDTKEAVLVGRDGSIGDALATAFIFMDNEERLSLASKENIKFAIYDGGSINHGWSYMSEGLDIELRKTTK